MSTTDERPTVEERYSVAIEASSLKMTKERSSSIDVIIAAGMSGDTLGASLARLRAEFDAVRAEHELAERNLKAGEAVADAEAKSAPVGPTREAKIRADAIAAAVTARALVLMELKTLGSTKRLLGEHAIQQASWWGFEGSQLDALKLAGRALDAFLDPNCPACEGRGFSGGGRLQHSGPRIRCKHCGETGKRSAQMGKNDVEREFALHLLDQMTEKTRTAMDNTARRLRNREGN